MALMNAEAINSGTIDYLLSEPAAAELAGLRTRDLSEGQTLALLHELRTRVTGEEAGALLALARLRQRAAVKFPAADSLFFTAEALEQATAAPIAAHHAAWLDRHAPPGPLLELGCGIGGDTLALAVRRPVIAYETDPVRLQLARANAAARGLSDRVTFVLEDWTAALDNGTLPDAAGAFADPARRVNGRRVFRLGAMQPPISALLRLQRRVPLLGVKVMPGVEDDDVPPACGVEFIGHERACKEAVLWFGAAAVRPRWASIHEGNIWFTYAADRVGPPVGPLAPGMTLYEPHPALIRAGALRDLADELRAHLFDDQIAYLAARERQKHPLAQSFVIDYVEPFSLKVLNRLLVREEIGQVELKKRGFPTEPESLRKRLKLTPGGRDATVFFTRRGDERLMLVGRRL